MCKEELLDPKQCSPFGDGVRPGVKGVDTLFKIYLLGRFVGVESDG